MNIKKQVGRVLYALVKNLPVSYRHFGFVGKALRNTATRMMLPKCGKNINIERNAKFSLKCTIGDNSGIGINANIEEVHIGNNVLMGPNCTIYSRNHRFDDCSVPIINQGYSAECPVTIGDDVWIGGNVTILPGVIIGNHCVIGACSVVTKNTPDWAVVVGNPATVKKYRNDIRHN